MKIADDLLGYFSDYSEFIDEKIESLSESYEGKIDPWGLNLDTLSTSLKVLYPIYKKYFKVKIFGMENIPKDHNFIAVANHSGQIPIDGTLIIAAFILETQYPKLLRGMGERFLFKFPLLSRLVAESGTILGDRKNCRYLLEQGESILVFPEGTKGISKPTSKFYQLQRFTQGFYRLALEYNTDILPISVIGAEEFYPLVYHNKNIANFLNVPAFPITPLFPLGGLLGLIPMPSEVHIHIGKPVSPNPNLSPTSEKASLSIEIDKIKNQIQEKINEVRGKE